MESMAVSATGGRLVSFYTRCLLVSDIECVLFVVICFSIYKGGSVCEAHGSIVVYSRCLLEIYFGPE